MTADRTVAGTPNSRTRAALASFEPRHGEAPASRHVVRKPALIRAAGGTRARPAGTSQRYDPDALPSRPGPHRLFKVSIRRECARSPRPHVSLSVTAGGVRTHRAAGTAPAGSTATFTGVRPPAGTPAYPMIPGWRPPPGPGSPGVRRHPAGSPAIPGTRSPSPAASGRPPAGPPFTPLRRDPRSAPPPGGRSPRGRHDGRGRQRTTAIQEDPVGGYVRWAMMQSRGRAGGSGGRSYVGASADHYRLIHLRRSREGSPHTVSSPY